MKLCYLIHYVRESVEIFFRTIEYTMLKVGEKVL